MKGKHAVSPLIATVLLIAFAVALGAVVMNWGRTQITGNTPTEGLCNNVNFGVEKINDKPNVCYSPNNILVFVHNDGNQVINKLKVIVLSGLGKEPYNKDVEIEIQPFETKKLTINIPKNYGQIEKIRMIPYVLIDKDKKDYNACSNNIVEIIYPPKCS